jgi:hypothetical protein
MNDYKKWTNIQSQLKLSISFRQLIIRRVKHTRNILKCTISSFKEYICYYSCSCKIQLAKSDQMVDNYYCHEISMHSVAANPFVTTIFETVYHNLLTICEYKTDWNKCPLYK